MEEAERLCDRIGIVDLGELKAEGTRDLVALVGEHDRVTLEGAGDLAGARCARAQELAQVQAASVQDGAIQLIVDDARSVLARAAARRRRRRRRQ